MLVRHFLDEYQRNKHRKVKIDIIWKIHVRYNKS